jgi:dUTP pyrophosphatase
MNIYFKKLHPNAVMPKQATLYAGGWDVTATEIERIGNDQVVCKLGFALQLPAGYRLMIQPRSSISKTKWVMQNSPGLGDPDYFGEYRIYFRALPSLAVFYQDVNPSYPSLNFQVEKWKIIGYEQFPYKAGDRIGQCYLEKIIDMRFWEVDELNQIGDRDAAGYGTTGK